jgi:hypothetical protein
MVKQKMAEKYLTIKQAKMKHHLTVVKPPGFTINVQTKAGVLIKNQKFKSQTRYISPQMTRFSRYHEFHEISIALIAKLRYRNDLMISQAFRQPSSHSIDKQMSFISTKKLSSHVEKRIRLKSFNLDLQGISSPKNSFFGHIGWEKPKGLLAPEKERSQGFGPVQPHKNSFTSMGLKPKITLLTK